jgi:hypothetical protein
LFLVFSFFGVVLASHPKWRRAHKPRKCRDITLQKVMRFYREESCTKFSSERLRTRRWDVSRI